MPAVLRTIGAAAVVLVALIGVLTVLEIISASALKEWITKVGLVIVIFGAAAVAIGVLMRSGQP
jgi:hypothetical protein